MSHIVEIKTEVRDANAVRTACQRLGLGQPEQGTVQLFSGQVTGLAIQLPGWRYPVVADLDSGQLKYDNYQGRWGEQAKLDQFLQVYTVEKAKIEARKQGHAVTERPLSDGSVKLTIQVNGGAS